MGVWQRIVGDLFARLDGPLHFRFIVQPLVAIIFAVIDGVKDAKAGKPAYFWALLSTPEYRAELVKDAGGPSARFLSSRRFLMSSTN
jgi:hypothetical protein